MTAPSQRMIRALLMTNTTPDRDFTPSWARGAACAGQHDLFDATLSESQSDRSDQDELRRLCGGCPVRVRCLSVGVATKSWGMWGGQILVGGRIAAPPADGRVWPTGQVVSEARENVGPELNRAS